MSLSAGARLGPYEILSVLGAGGMGEVYKARDTRLDRIVAIKVLTEGLAADPQFRDRFEREARTISQLKHPNICTLHDIGRQDGVDFLVMEFLDGETVGARVEALKAKGKGVPLDDAISIAIQVGDGLAAAHTAGIVHRDLKPGNVMLTPTGAKLLDFGLAKSGGRIPGAPGTGQAAIHLADLSAPMTMTSPLTSQGAIVGTVQYMAPEQLEGKEADTRSDIFAFGALVHEMLTGARAFQGKTLVSVMASILEHEPPPLSSANASVPASLTRVVQKCLAKDPNRRWQSAADLADELRWIADEVRSGVARLKPGTTDATDQKTSSTNTTGAAEFVVSRGGTLVYAPGSGSGGTARSLVWVARDGREEPIKAPPRAYTFLQLSPDRTRAALDVRDQERDIWVWDFAHERLSRLTLDPAVDFFPVWTPDGRRIAFQSSREGSAGNMFWQAADGTGTAERLTRSPNPQQPNAFSPDGAHLIFNETSPKTNVDIGMLALNRNGPTSAEPRPEMIVQTTFNEGNADVSPDGRWLAYQSNDSGQLEVFVRPFPKTDSGHWQISTNGGGRPIWSRDGRELFYIDLSNALMAVAVRTTPAFSADNPGKLFDTTRYFPNIAGRTYDVSADGKRFLMIKDAAAADQTSPAATGLVVVEHWVEELKARVATK